MGLGDERPQISLVRTKPRSVLHTALLVLEGAGRAELARASALAGVLSDQCMLVAVDGGLHTCRAAGRRPDLFIGDGDSVTKVPRGIPSVHLRRDKDFSDFKAALRESGARGAELVVVAGLLGGRVDHEWANVQEIGAQAKRFAAIVAPTERGTVISTARGCDAVTVPNRTFSLFALGARALLTLSGARWNLRRKFLRPGATGLSNVTGSALRLRVHQGVAALVFPSKTTRGQRKTSTTL